MGFNSGFKGLSYIDPPRGVRIIGFLDFVHCIVSGTAGRVLETGYVCVLRYKGLVTPVVLKHIQFLERSFLFRILDNGQSSETQ